MTATLAVGFASVSGQQNSGECPTLELIRPAGLINPTERATVVARMTGDFVVSSVSYEWKTSRGRIIAGQGTPAITLYTGEDDQGKNLEVTVAARGLPATCDVKVSGSIAVASIPEFDAMDELGNVGPRKTDLWDFLSRLDTFMSQIQSSPGSEGFLVIDFNSKDTSDHKIQHLKRIFDHFAFRRFDLARLTIALSERNYPEKTTLMGTWPPKATVPKYVRGYKIINAEDYRSNLSSLFPLDSSAARTFREPPAPGPDRFWFELPARGEDLNRELDHFFDELENNPDQEGIVEITYRRNRDKKNARDELLGQIERRIGYRHFDRTRISYYPRISDNQRIRIIRVPPGSNYDHVGIDLSKLIKAEEYSPKIQ